MLGSYTFTMLNANTPLKQLSIELFGRVHRLDIWRAVVSFEGDPPAPFYMRQIQDAVRGDVDPHMISNELATLEKWGMVTRVPEHHDRRIYFRRLDSPGWGILGLAIVMAGDQPPNSGEAPDVPVPTHDQEPDGNLLLHTTALAIMRMIDKGLIPEDDEVEALGERIRSQLPKQ
jgi:hypothetical protein